MTENELKWNERFNIGVDEVDNAHQRLFSIVSRLIRLNEEEKNRKFACQEGVKYFKSYTIKHFASEERYMQYIEYSGLDMHKRLHDNLRDKTLPALERELEESDYSPEAVQHFLGICIGWLTGHIMIEDRAITGKVANKWIHDAKDDEMADLERSVIQMIQEVFGRQATLVSSHYGGEDFGKALFFRFIYQTVGGERIKVYLGQEERMIFRTISDMVGKDIHKIDKTVEDAVCQLSLQMVKRIVVHFDKTKACKQLEKVNRLSHEQLLREFDKGYLPYSMLFDTGVGYFVFCAKL